MSDGAEAPAAESGNEPSAPAAPAKPAEPSGKTFSQDELDRIVQQRLAKEQKKYEGFDDLKAKAEKLAEIEDSQRSESEKTATRMAELERSNTANSTANQELRLENAVLRVAAKPDIGIIDADAAVKLLDHSLIEYDSDGNPKNLEKLLKQLAEERPYLVGNSGRTTSFDGGARSSSPGAGSFDALIRSART